MVLICYLAGNDSALLALLVRFVYIKVHKLVRVVQRGYPYCYTRIKKIKKEGTFHVCLLSFLSNQLSDGDAFKDRSFPGASAYGLNALWEPSVHFCS